MTLSGRKALCQNQTKQVVEEEINSKSLVSCVLILVSKPSYASTAYGSIASSRVVGGYWPPAGGYAFR